jgi:FMN phosphatase YigB (HAD superfamily)
MKNTEKADYVVYDENVKLTFFELIDTLYQEEYFSFLDEAKEYVFEIELYFKTEIPNLYRLGLSKKAMLYFKKYGKNLFFVAYRRTKSRTTWYAFFEVFDEHYFKVVHITNNHTKDASYIEY